jgi:hypothetical protein
VIATLADALRSLRVDMKLAQGQCENCWKPLPDNAEPIDGYRVCSPECAYNAWLDSFV